MPRDLSSTQIAALEAPATRPIVVVAWEHSGAEELVSCSGDITLDGKNYTAGDMSVKEVNDDSSATVHVPATSARITEVQNGTWRGGTCKIYLIPASPSDSPIFTAGQSILVLDGIIKSSQFSGNKVSAQIIHTNFDGNYSPRDIIDSASNHVPAIGSQIDWEGERYVFVGRR